MKRTATSGHPLIAFAAVALLLAACSDGAPSTKGPGLRYGESPLAEYLGSAWGYDDDAAQVAADEAVAQCMADQGFEYTVRDAGSTDESQADYDPDEMNSESWVAANGFHVWSIYEEAAPAPDANAEYVASLSEASRAEYDAALYGEYGEGMTEEELQSYVPSPEEQGCFTLSAQAAPATSFLDDPKYSRISEQMGALHQASLKDPAVLAAVEEWSGCMADAGHAGYTSQDEMLSELFAEYEDLYGWTAGEATVTPAPQEVTEMREREVTLALADLTCREEVGYDDVFLTTLHAAQEQFIADNKSELDEIVAEYGS